MEIAIIKNCDVLPTRKKKTDRFANHRIVHTPTTPTSSNGIPFHCSRGSSTIPPARQRTAVLSRRNTFNGRIPVDARYLTTPRTPMRSGSDDSNTSSSSGSEALTPYEQAIHNLATEERWQKEILLGTRVGLYRLYRDLGKGNFSRVKVAVHWLTKEKVAVKIIDKSKLQLKTRRMLTREISTMETVHHPHIIRLFEVLDTPTKVYLAMEFAEGGELFYRISTGGRLPEHEAKIVFAQVTSAVIHMLNYKTKIKDLNVICCYAHTDDSDENEKDKFYGQLYDILNSVKKGDITLVLGDFNDKVGTDSDLWGEVIGPFGIGSCNGQRLLQHKRNIIHRDLKAENVFIAGPNLVKVGDFGFSTHVRSPDEALATFCGSPPYAAPELFHSDSYVGASVDLWSLGVLLFLMVTATLPFKGDTINAVKKQILSGHFTIPQHVSAECGALIVGLLQQDPTQRFSTIQIRSCDWLKGVKFPEAPKENNSRAVAAGKESKKTLLQMGITEKMVQDQEKRGARSSIIGTYRIVLHKVEKAQAVIADGQKLNAKNRNTNRNTSGAATKSKTCTLV